MKGVVFIIDQEWKKFTQNGNNWEISIAFEKAGNFWCFAENAAAGNLSGVMCVDVYE